MSLWLALITIPVILAGFHDMYQTKRSILRNYPLAGRGRYWMEELRPKIYQYFIESDTDGTPFSRIYRSIVYQRAKEQLATTPFGTQLDVNQVGYEWINHSMNALQAHEMSHDSLRVSVGGKDCTKPYSCSILNISAMSYGSLSSNAVEALNWGAKIGGFAHNTGEGSISDFHKKHGGDLIWQIGTGYFGCRDEDGNFNEEMFAKNASLDQVKMIEIKLSQGAKPGHGGILPAGKNTAEIARIRGVKQGTDVLSPPRHSAFSNSQEMIAFIAKLRRLSGGKPVGFKMCFGNPNEFEDLCRAMMEVDTYPDYIAIDGGEGGTGAAPLEFSNSIGMALKDGLILTDDILTQYGIRDKIKIFASGKMLSGFQMVKSLALGADAIYCARAFMLSLGCIQALVCNRNNCPTGVATQDPSLTIGLVVTDKCKRVANFHKHTLESVEEIVSAAGLKSIQDLRRNHIWRRISVTKISNYEELFPYQNPRV